MVHPPVIIVDERDRPTGLARLQDAWAKGLWYRTVQVMVEDGSGNVLLQKRAATAELFPGRWEMSAAGHVDEGFTYEQAARAETIEELGLPDPKLEEIGYYSLHNEYPDRAMHHFSRVYRTNAAPWSVRPNPDEVAEVRWFSLAEAKQLVHDHPAEVTDVLREIITRYY